MLEEQKIQLLLSNSTKSLVIDNMRKAHGKKYKE
jgi:hypothetical protein